MTAPEPVTPRVVLVGPMGAGKTTVGRLLASRWGVEVRDTDHDVEATAGKEISEIFVDEGEDRFRLLERAAVVEALGSHPGVLALGGGAVLDPATRAGPSTPPSPAVTREPGRGADRPARGR